MDKNELLQTITSPQRELAELVSRISDDRLQAPAMDDWTGKDLLAHLASWHDHSVLVIEGLRAGRQPYDSADPDNATDALNERIHREHLDDPPQVTREAFQRSFDRLLVAIGTLTEADVFAADRWPWLEGEALVEIVLWDTFRHYQAHLAHLAPLAHTNGR